MTFFKINLNNRKIALSFSASQGTYIQPSATMRELIFLIMIAATVAQHTPSSMHDSGPTILQGATPDEVLLYLYDVVLTSHFLSDTNEQGIAVVVMTEGKCPKGTLKKRGKCISKPPIINDYEY